MKNLSQSGLASTTNMSLKRVFLSCWLNVISLALCFAIYQMQEHVLSRLKLGGFEVFLGFVMIGLIGGAIGASAASLAIYSLAKIGRALSQTRMRLALFLCAIPLAFFSWGAWNYWFPVKNELLLIFLVAPPLNLIVQFFASYIVFLLFAALLSKPKPLKEPLSS